MSRPPQETHEGSPRLLFYITILKYLTLRHSQRALLAIKDLEICKGPRSDAPVPADHRSSLPEEFPTPPGEAWGLPNPHLRIQVTPGQRAGTSWV